MAAAISKGDYLAVLLFGGGALFAVALIQGARIRRGGKISANFVKLFGLVAIATLAAVLAIAGVDNEARTGAFTLLGTIAGYLAGSRETTKTTEPTAGEAQETTISSL